MTRLKTLQELFKRYRRPGDLVFAVLFLVFSIFLLLNLEGQTSWVKRTKLFAQPAFWPTVSLVTMTGFAALHCIGSLASPRIPGRWQETIFWLRSFEYAAWFILYSLLAPWLGYLPSTILFTTMLALRLGYRGWRPIGTAVGLAFVIVIIFKSLLQVKVPGGKIYELLPDFIRPFMLTYF